MITVKEIHADFVHAQERIVAEAKRIINRPHKELTDKANRLKSLGFTAVKDAIIGTNIVFNMDQQKELLSLVDHYRYRYPFNQFITEKEVERLCKKYGLVFGPADRFTGDIPEKNLVEIENFKLLEEDILEDFFEPSPFFYHFLAGLHGEMPFHGSVEQERGRSRKFKPAFKMVAVYQDFDTSDMTLKGYKLEQNLPDPIVLQPVKGGYLIVSKWGDEASDKSVVNEKMN